jgi:hypothetical protein
VGNYLILMKQVHLPKFEENTSVTEVRSVISELTAGKPYSDIQHYEE